MERPETPHAPIPQTDNYDGYNNLEVYSESGTGIETLLNSQEGFIVGRLGNELLRYKTDAHLLTISPTGGGKTTGAIIPNILDHPGACFVIDIRGETVAKTANTKRMQGHSVVVLDPYNITEGAWGLDFYNPIERVAADAHNITSDDQVQRLVNGLMYDAEGRSSNEPIWDNATKVLLSGLISYCTRYQPAYKHNLVEILDILHYTPNELEEFLLEILTVMNNDPQAKRDRQLKGLVKILTEGKSKTKVTDNALMQAQTMLNWVGNRAFYEMLTSSTFSFEHFRRDKMIVYLVIPEEYIDNCAAWTRIMIESAVFSLNDIYKSHKISTSELPQKDKVLFLIDELPAFGQLDIVSKGMATLRGRGINLWLFVQNMAQLDDIYGEKKARTIIGNASSIQVFKSNELEELEYFVRLIGEDFFDIQTISIGTTTTKGSSTAISQTRTINNSESVTDTHGSADTIGESTGITWNETAGSSTSKGNTYGVNSGYSKGTSEGRSSGTTKGTGNTFQRNFLSSTNLNENKSTGTSSGTTSSSNESKNLSRSSSANYTNTTNQSNTQGGNKGKSITHAENTSHARSVQHGESFATGETQTNSESNALNRSISVKKERLKIETVRSLREKLSDRNQLLQIRGSHPFFSPRMSYFVKFVGEEQYMFPDAAALTSRTVIDEIITRLRSYPAQNLLQQANRLSTEISSNPINIYLATKNGQCSLQALHNTGKVYSKFINHDINHIVKELAAIENRLRIAFKNLEEPFIAVHALVSLTKTIKPEIVAALQSVMNQHIQLSINLNNDIITSVDHDLYQTPVFPKNENFELLAADFKNSYWLMEQYSPLIKSKLSPITDKLSGIKGYCQNINLFKSSLLSIVNEAIANLDIAESVAISLDFQRKINYIKN